MISFSDVRTVQRCEHHLRLWLAAGNVTYCGAAREDFARAHPDLFGFAFVVALRGYEQWRRRQRLGDTVESFALYLVCRHERWLVANSHSTGLAPCLIDRHRPCWRSAGTTSTTRSNQTAAA
jgi:hypothetical protein